MIEDMEYTNDDKISIRKKGGLFPVVRALFGEYEDCDWSEDSGREGGCYCNKCISCRVEFVGHKAREACKVCAR